MRNLKKFLALMMALVMAFSLMITVNAAELKPSTNYADASGITEEFVEAVDVLTGMGVFGGDNGNFKPGAYITRGEMAAIIYRLSTGDVGLTHGGLYNDYGNFTDVSASDWFAPYVGYCANGLIIKGYEDGSFRPYGNVTGYEALAMMMRAVGYDANKEFTGADWSVQVARYAQQLGITDDVKATVYGSSLYGPARRDVVASMLLKTALRPQVTWTQIGGYNMYQNQSLVGGGGGLTSGQGGQTVLNQSLGRQYFGLVEEYRVVLGNQATGEKYTQLGAAINDDETVQALWSEYAYPGETVDILPSGTAVVNTGAKVDAKTGLELFGHKVKVWYDVRDKSANSDGAQPTYALYDKATLAAMVKIDEDNTLNASATSGGFTSFAEAASDKGFAKLAATDKVYFSASFSRIGGGDDGKARATDVLAGSANSNTAMDGTTATAGKESETGDVSKITSTIWVLISNGKDKKVDVAIPVVLDLAEINTVDNHASTKTFSLKDDASTTIGTATNYGHANALVAKTNQSKVMDPEQIVLGNTVIAVEITHNTKDEGDPVYWLDTPTKTVTKTVVAIDSTTKEVTFSDGTTLKRTIIADAHLVSGKNNVKTISAPMEYAQYEFLLDTQGNWINAKRVYDESFLYATYLDYGTELGTSTFTHRLVGVDMNGQMKYYDINKYNIVDGTSANTKSLDGTTGTGTPDVLGIPYRTGYLHTTSPTGTVGQTMVKRDTAGTNFDYKGFIINGTTAKGYVAVLDTVAGIQSFGNDSGIAGNFQAETDTSDKNGDNIPDNRLVVDKDALKLGVVKVPETSSVVNLYLTQQTKFIVVDGYGTDSLKPTVYEGLEKFLDGGSSVYIDMTAANIGEILYTSSPYVYANTGASARQVDTIFIPKAELNRVGVNNLYFFPSKTDIVDSNGSGAELFTAYKDGEKVNVWVDTTGTGIIDATIDATPKYGSFQYLEATSSKAADGQTIYKIQPTMGPTYDAMTPASTTAVCYTGTTNKGLTFLGTTNNGLTALVRDDSNTYVVGTANAKVVNLADDWTIENINDLNDVASVNGTLVTKVKVDIQFVDAGNIQVAYIYVVDVTA